MKVTAIKQQQKRADRYSVYIDDAYAFSLSESQLLSSGVRTGLEVKSSDIERFKTLSDEGKLFDRVLNLLSYRPRSEWEVRDYLKRKNASEDHIEAIIGTCKKLGYVNDHTFARLWVENRRLGKPISRRKLKSELQAKRVAPEIIEAILRQDSEGVDERTVLQVLVAKKRGRYADETKFMQYLARQGFNYEDIKRALGR